MTNLFVILALLFSIALPSASNANEQGFGVPRITAYPSVRPVSREGKVTGNNCRSDNDCMVGCVAGQPDDLKCLTPAEASNECVEPDKAPSSEYPCACLPDVMRCGFTFAKPKVEEAPAAVQEQPAPVKVTKKKVHKKTTHKKAGHKKPAHKSSKHTAVTKPAPAAAPTPITEPAHDSGQ